MNFTSADERAYMSPSSSPASSPDSSPDPFYSRTIDSSPNLEPLELPAVEDDSAWVMDPYAGARHGKPPRMYEKKMTLPAFSIPPVTPAPLIFNRANATDTFEELFHDVEQSTYESMERKVWRETVESAINDGEQNIDLSQRGLTYIDDCVRDLESVVSVSDVHIDSVSSPKRTFGRTQSGSLTASTGGPGLNLSQNEIHALPQPLFALSNITFLYLRNNRLTAIPPQIAELRSLTHFNVALNQLSSLPAEICTLPLTSLIVHPNHFLPDPSRHLGPDQPRPCHPWRAVGSIVEKFVVPSLNELIMRQLISPSQAIALSRTPSSHHVRSPHNSPMRQRVLTATATLSNFKAHFALPLTGEHAVPEHYARMLENAERGSVSRPLSRAPTQNSDPFSRSPTLARSASGLTSDSDRTLAEDSSLAPSRCPSPRHLPEGTTDPGPESDWARRGPLYYAHAEERFVWVKTIRGIKIGEATGGVPLLWRGCERGCLDFLGNPWPEIGGQDDDMDTYD